MKKQNSKLLRLVSLALFLILALSPAAMAAPALENAEEDAIILQEQAAETETPMEETAEEAVPEEPTAVAAETVDATDSNDSTFWQNFGMLSYRWRPGDPNFWNGYFYNTKNAWQRIFGFNKVYDALSFLAGCSYDTIRVQFNYGGREWMVQLWKGRYMFGLCTGGEIGLYNRRDGSSGSHYSCALQKDWIGMQFSIYSGTQRLFQLPMEDEAWWATGYKPYILPNQGTKPRPNCTMNATLRFKDAGMAQAFAQALAAKDFAAASGTLRLDESLNTERYVLNGSTVQLLWRNKTEK